jgi:hypothetical protein
MGSVRRYGDFDADGVLLRCVDRLFGKRAQVWQTRSADRDRQNRRRTAEINRQAVVQGSATASMVMAGREPAKQKCSTGMSPRTCTDHDVSILITAVDGAGRKRGEEPRWNVSMMIMRPPQHGHGCESGLGSLASAQLVSLASG